MRKIYRRLIVWGALSFAAFGIGYYTCFQSPSKFLLELPRDGARLIRRDASVTLYQIGYGDRDSGKGESLHENGFHIRSKGYIVRSRPAPEGWVEKAEALFGEKQIQFVDPTLKKACSPAPGMVARFERDGKVLDWYVCLECDQTYFGWAGKPTSVSDIDVFHEEFQALMQEGLPELFEESSSGSSGL